MSRLRSRRRGGESQQKVHLGLVPLQRFVVECTVERTRRDIQSIPPPHLGRAVAVVRQLVVPVRLVPLLGISQTRPGVGQLM